MNLPANPNQKVIIAMSGGVDSSVAAALLKEQGYNVIGITMQIWEPKKEFGGCCALSAIEDAKKVALKLGIPHYVLNFRKEFEEKVIKYFIEEYKNGRTPNPCVKCNELIKFDLLARKARELGAFYVATGHYVRIGCKGSRDQGIKKNIEYKLLKGIDEAKDQSYVLYMMNQETLKHSLFPLGELTKKEVRKTAKEFGLPVHDKEESQEICFVENDNYGSFLRERIPEYCKPGNLLDTNGNIIGKHNGIIFYTIGQRKGIGAHKKRKYVVEIYSKENTVVIGDNEDLLKKELRTDNLTFVSGEFQKNRIEICAKIRYNSPEVKATLILIDKKEGKVVFKEPQRAVTPGQSVVFYDGDEVLGGGIITNSEKT
ncbi:tRNA 2-thiouridine(34) synthase MnmA [candidate division WOR-1 bacterium RIFOXYD2_FULL_36_8]|nr:MAG: tRNA 2-thiouridine(34) synthase MnmA [candidate division WOR-1 bacterium RIFOXYD2_FULL_36_8]